MPNNDDNLIALLKKAKNPAGSSVGETRCKCSFGNRRILRYTRFAEGS
jgi:hypothetical protein